MNFDQYLLTEDVTLQRGSQKLELRAGQVLTPIEGRNDAFILPSLDLILKKEIEDKILGAQELFKAPPDDAPVVFVLGPKTWPDLCAEGPSQQAKLGSLGEAIYLQRTNVAAGRKKIWELRRHETE